MSVLGTDTHTNSINGPGGKLKTKILKIQAKCRTLGYKEIYFYKSNMLSYSFIMYRYL